MPIRHLGGDAARRFGHQERGRRAVAGFVLDRQRMAVERQIARRQVWKPHSSFKGGLGKFSTGEASMSGDGTWWWHQQLDTGGDEIIIDSGLMILLIGQLSKVELKAFIAWDRRRTPDVASSEWPTFKTLHESLLRKGVEALPSAECRP
jgi:hypothetical protein